MNGCMGSTEKPACVRPDACSQDGGVYHSARPRAARSETWPESFNDRSASAAGVPAASCPGHKGYGARVKQAAAGESSRTIPGFPRIGEHTTREGDWKDERLGRMGHEPLLHGRRIWGSAAERLRNTRKQQRIADDEMRECDQDNGTEQASGHQRIAVDCVTPTGGCGR